MENTDVCPECNGEAILRKDKEIEINIPESSLHIIKSDCFECLQCGEEIFDEAQGLEFAKKIDKIQLENSERKL